MTIKEALLATICYSDIFDYPLTASEAETWLIGKRQTLQDIPEIIHKDGYIFLRGRAAIVPIRKQKEVWSGKKLEVAKQSVSLLKIIPTIQFIGITGGLAMNNAHKLDDIDFYIATRRKTIWVTRLLATLVLDMYKLRRKPNDTEFQNKICLNMYVDEDHLAVLPKERDLFSAHEVLQMKPLWEKDNIYEKFLYKNQWVKKYLPNAWEEKIQSVKLKFQNRSIKHEAVMIFRFSVLRFAFWVLRLWESPLRTAQLWYMQRRRSSEVVSDTLIRFHPKDARIWVKAKYAVRLGKYNIPLDKIFFGR